MSLAGSGHGTATSSPAGIACPGSCSHSYTLGTVVTLTATPMSGSTFAGWSGAGCSASGPCVVTMSAARSVTATFTAVTSKPTVSDATLSPKSFTAKKGATLKMTLSAASNVRVVIHQAGHKVKGKCKAHAKEGKKCVLMVKTLHYSGVAGANSFKLNTRGLKPGRYTLVITASNAAGTSGPTAIKFKIKK